MKARRHSGSLLIVVLSAFVIVPAVCWLDGSACTTFVINSGDDLVFGKNLDWKTSLGLVIINKSGIQKTSLVEPPEKSISWVSKYGSITFNQVGKEFPYGGINEAGLVVEQMMLSQTQYPPADDRPVACEVQWIQFQLDNYRSVKEVIASDSVIRIGQAGARLHYLVADGTGNVATIEFLDGKTVIHTGGELPVAALANSSYRDCLVHMKRNNNNPDAMPDGSIYRFALAAKMIGKYETNVPGNVVEYSFDILESVGQSMTVWSIVYDIKNLVVYFRTSEYPDIKIINLQSFDFGCDARSKMIEMDVAISGIIDDDFVDYDPETNIKIVLDAFKVFRADGFLPHMEDTGLRESAEILNSYRCVD